MNTQDPEAGIDREFARERRERLSTVDYELRFRLEPGAKTVTGSVAIRFAFVDEDTSPATSLFLDWSGAPLTNVRLNGIPQSGLSIVEDHVELPSDRLDPGANSFEAEFSTPVAAGGTALTVYRDANSGSEYWYTLLVPADAHQLFPCFDQPDIKARFTLMLDMPTEWRALANGAEVEVPTREATSRGGERTIRFARSEPLPTYLFAFAAGPFEVAIDTTALDFARSERPPVPGDAGTQPITDPVLKNPSGQRYLRLFYRPEIAARVDQETLFAMHRGSLDWLQNWFGVGYPFSKCDFVLLPGFPYGGMEHAGAIFYRERGLAPDGEPTRSEKTSRSTLIYHEVSHQWFGNLVTMEWFDDLWLKEGFATFAAYRCLAALEPNALSWLRFQQRVKPRAYEVDATAGTTPVYQALANLADAKSAYGPIVYNKAPAVLRVLEHRIGEPAMRAGLQAFLQRHAFANARWEDLAAALDAASDVALDEWSSRWILSPSMPVVRLQRNIDAAAADRFRLLQQPAGDVLGEAIAKDATWPLDLEILRIPTDGTGERQRVLVQSNASSISIKELADASNTDVFLLNPGDVAYGRFLPDAQSRDWFLKNLGGESDPLVRSAMTVALFESVRETELDPRRYFDVVLALAAEETDAETLASQLDSLAVCLRRYVSTDTAKQLAATAEQTLLPATAMAIADGEQEVAADGLDRDVAVERFRFLARFGESAEMREACERVARGQETGGQKPTRRDRFLAATAVLAEDPAKGEELLVALEQAYAGDDVARELWVARCANPDLDAKKARFKEFFDAEARPESWVIQALGPFHGPGQEDATDAFLAAALADLPELARTHRIFFVPRWIQGFVGHRGDANAQKIAQEALKGSLTTALRRKLLQATDELRRAVRVREAFPD